MATALNSPDYTDAKVVHRAMLEVGRMLQWPVNRVIELKGSVGE